MNSKRKGNIGEMAVALELAKHEYSVFTEQGDISRIDIIAEKNGKVIRIQCKAITPKNGRLQLELIQKTNVYSYTYEIKDFDYFAVIDLNTMKMYLVPSEIALKNKTIFTLRVDAPKKKQTNIHLAEDYEINKMLLKHERE